MTDNNNNRVTLPLHLDLNNVAEIREKIIESADKDKMLEIDISGLQGIDTAGIQLLVVATEASSGKGVKISGVSAGFSERAESLGLSDFFENKMAE